MDGILGRQIEGRYLKMRELTNKEIEVVSGGIFGWLANRFISAYNNIDRQAVGAWAYNNGNFRRSMP